MTSPVRIKSGERTSHQLDVMRLVSLRPMRSKMRACQVKDVMKMDLDIDSFLFGDFLFRMTKQLYQGVESLATHSALSLSREGRNEVRSGRLLSH